MTRALDTHRMTLEPKTHGDIRPATTRRNVADPLDVELRDVAEFVIGNGTCGCRLVDRAWEISDRIPDGLPPGTRGRRSRPTERRRLIVSTANDEEAPASLGNAEIGRVEDFPLHRITDFVGAPQKGREVIGAANPGQGRNVLHQEIPRTDLRHQSQEVEEKLVARVAGTAAALTRETLAGRATGDE